MVVDSVPIAEARIHEPGLNVEVVVEPILYGEPLHVDVEVTLIGRLEKDLAEKRDLVGELRDQEQI